MRQKEAWPDLCGGCPKVENTRKKRNAADDFDKYWL